jgi:hypothetical protein
MTSESGWGKTQSLKGLCLVSGVYDVALALPLLFLPVALARAFGAPDPVPVLNAQLKGLFTLVLGVGYFWAARDVAARRGYLWCAGVLAKGLGATLFVADHVLRASPSSFLLLAATDGSLCLVTLFLLLRSRR